MLHAHIVGAAHGYFLAKRETVGRGPEGRKGRGAKKRGG